MFCHVLPRKYKEAILGRTPQTSYYYEADSIRPALWDPDIRLKLMDKVEGLKQVLSAGLPPVEYVASPSDAYDLARMCNDEMSELVQRHSERFPAAIACLPLNDIDGSLRETERAIKELKFRGIQMFTSVNGKPSILLSFSRSMK
jgi:aminocarboxymuconate-semialdehyde decarboxylase